MACRLPGADSVDAFWENLANGVESIGRLTNEELAQAGVPHRFLNDPSYVKAAPILAAPEFFDAAFFGFSPTEAAALDPQHRILLELAHEALEDAGCDPDRYAGRIGVFTGAAMNTYFMNNGLTSRFAEDYIPTLIVNDKDFLSTRLSYKLNLKGPSITIQTACSTSLVAIHLARQSLLSHETDTALAGAISVRVPHRAGYFCDGGGVVSPDGHVRAFDAKANGTVFGSGGGIVILKRLADAIASRDTIHAVIKGSAVNNDGSEKAGYTAPSVNSQADAVVEALANAGVDAESVSYVEAHGSGTPVGDPIELMALTKAFRAFTARSSYCAIGSVKTNVGHLDAAAGIAGIIKTVLALKHRKIPPTLHYTQPNPEIDFAQTPFYVNTQLASWDGVAPRRAGIMSTGMGGTNAHVVLEEAPVSPKPASSTLPQLLVLSAMSSTALEAATNRLADFLERNTEVEIADVAHTLQLGRKAFAHRRVLVSADREDAIAVLREENSKRIFSSHVDESSRPPIVFLLPGVGDQYVGMAHELYKEWDVFREEVDHCAKLLERHLGVDIRTAIFASNASERKAGAKSGIDLKAMLSGKANESDEQATQTLNQTIFAQPALFTIEYALARLWQHLGVTPTAIVGHSMGEYVAACLAGVFSLEDALGLIAHRAKLANGLPEGSMLAVLLSEPEITPLLSPELSISLINGPNLCVIAGPTLAIANFGKLVEAKGIITRPVRNTHAFHSRMLDPIVPAFVEEVRKVRLLEPKIPFISNVTGNWITNEEATDPAYWGRHASQTARFSDALHNLWQFKDAILLEVGPGKTLSVLAAQHPDRRNAGNAVTVSSLRHHYENQSDLEFLCHSVGKLWLTGIEIDWGKFPQAQRRRKISLPTYPFERQKYWLETVRALETDHPQEVSIQKNSDQSKWFYVPSWKRSLSKTLKAGTLTRVKDEGRTWVVFSNGNFTSQIVHRLTGFDQRVVTVEAGRTYQQLDSNSFVLEPNNSQHYELLIRALQTDNCTLGPIIHAWSLNESRLGLSPGDSFKEAQNVGFYSLLCLVRALGRQNVNGNLDLFVISNGIQEVHGKEALDPQKSTILGPCMVVSQEYPNIRTKSIDLELPDDSKTYDLIVEQVLGELLSPDLEMFVAYRNSQRWVQTYEGVELDSPGPDDSAFRNGGVYLITGGLGHIGYEISKYLAKNYQAKLVLVGRSKMPAKNSWDSWIANHPADNSITKAIGKITSIEAQGGEVLYIDAAVEDLSSMRTVIEQANTVFGDLHGVIHAAGVVEEQSYREVKAVDSEHGDAHFRVKARALLVLEDLLDGKELDFVLLISSLTSVLGGIGHAAYASSCIYLDSFARKHNRSSNTRWLSVNWDFWRVQGEANVDSGIGRSIQALGMKTEEALEAMETVLPVKQTSQLLVSTGNLNARINQWIKLESLHDGQLSLETIPNRAASAQSWNSNFDPPQNDTEERIAKIWQRMLGLDRVGVNDNFSDLGGHSLLAIKIISELRKAFAIDLPIKALFEAPTIAELAVYIEEQTTQPLAARRSNEVNEEPGISEKPNELLKEVRRESPLIDADDAFYAPCWFVQQQKWLENPSGSDNAIYNYPFLLRIRGNLNEAALRRSLQEIVRRHEVFRSVFRAKDGELVQVVMPASEQTLTVTDLRNVPKAEREGRSQEIALEQAKEPFNLARETLLRTQLLRLSDDNHILLLTTHHLVYDDWSTAIVSRELSELYEGFVHGKASPLADLNFQYGDFVRWQQEQLQSAGRETKFSFWKKQLTSSTDFNHLTTDFARPEESTNHGARERIVLPVDLKDSLKALSRQERVSLFMVLLTGFKCLLHHYSSDEEIGVGSCGANRPFAEAENLIGRFGNAMLLRTNLSGNPTFRELFQRVCATALTAYSDQNLPFGQLVREVRNGATPNGKPAFQTMFILQNAPQEDPHISGLSMSWSSLYNGTSKYDLDVWLKAEPELEVILEYRTDLFRAQTVKRILADYRTILDAMVKNPGMRIADASISKKIETVPARTGTIAAKNEVVTAGSVPTGDVQRRLIEFWEAAFRIHPISVDQNFFELGGDSLLAARLFPQIEKAFKVKLPLAILLEAPTIRQLSARIDGCESDSLGSCLVAVQTRGLRLPLFCVHGHMGEVFYCRNLSHSLGADQPMYGLRSYGLGGGSPHSTVEEMAVHNLTELRKLQPKGPYFLSGYCLGGMVAYEMARLLSIEGERVGLLVLFNTPAPGSFQGWPFDRAYLTKKIAHELKKFRKGSIREKLRILRNKGASLSSLALGRLKTAFAKSSLGGAQRAAQRLLSVADINISAAKAYSPKGYAGQIILFLTEEARSLYSVDPKEGWSALATKGVEVYAADGDNNSMFDADFVDALAEKLKSCIERTQRTNQVTPGDVSHLKYPNERLVASTAAVPM